MQDSKQTNKQTMNHNLLTLVEVLRTVIDERVSLRDIRLVLQDAKNNCKQPKESKQKEKEKQQTKEKERRLDLILNNITRTQTKEAIQFDIKQQYKQCQDFSLISDIHESMKHFKIISKVPKPRVRTMMTTTLDGDTPQSNVTTTLHATQNAFAIQDIMTHTFQYLDLKNVSLCRGVCQQWLDYASNPLYASIYHVDTSELPEIIDYFIDSKDIAKYNIHRIQGCQSFLVDTAHYDELVDYLPEMKNLQALTILMSYPLGSDNDLSNLIDIHCSDELNCVKVIVTQSMNAALGDMITRNTTDFKDDHHKTRAPTSTTLGTHYTTSMSPKINNFLREKDINNLLGIQPLINNEDDFRSGNIVSLGGLKQNIAKWNQLIGSMTNVQDKGIKTKFKNNYYEMNVYGINLAMKVGAERKRKWNTNVDLDLCDDKKLMNIIQSLYKWYQSGNVTVNVWFRVGDRIERGSWPQLHHDSSNSNIELGFNDIDMKTNHYSNQRERRRARLMQREQEREKNKQIEEMKKERHEKMDDHLKEQKWIQLIVKAVTTVFSHSNFSDSIIDDLSRDRLEYYPFDDNVDVNAFPKCVTLMGGRIKMKLFCRQEENTDMLVTTLCITVNAS